MEARILIWMVIQNFPTKRSQPSAWWSVQEEVLEVPQILFLDIFQGFSFS